MSEYYGAPTTPTEDFLAHYGIRGMKWGVRKAKMKGDAKKLSRAHEKAAKKLAKLEKRAENTKKYAKRATRMGIGAAAAGGLALAGTEGVATGMRKLIRPAARATKDIGFALTKVPGRNKVSQALHRTGAAMYTHNNKVGEALTKSATAVSKWGQSNSMANKATDATLKALRNSGVQGSKAATKMVTSGTVKNMRGISNNTIARVGAGLVGAGLAAGSARNAYKAATAKKKAEKFRAEMGKAFAGTQYAGNYSRSTSQSKKRRKR